MYLHLLSRSNMKKLLFLFIPVFAFAQTPYVTQTVTVTNDSTGTPIAAVVNAYFGVPSDSTVKTTSYDLVANKESVTVDGITVNYLQLAKLISAASAQQLSLSQPTVDIAPVLTTNNAVATPVVTTNNISILTTNNSQ